MGTEEIQFLGLADCAEWKYILLPVLDSFQILFQQFFSFLKTSKSADNEMLTWFYLNKEQILKLVFLSLRSDKGRPDGLIMLQQQ